MRNAKYSPTVNIMIRAAEKAARSLIRDFGEVEQLQVSRKGPADFVSAADIRAEKIIHEELSKAREGFGFMMEEQGEIEGEEGNESVWIIDPLDGTTNFLHGIPHWAVSIALQEKGEITTGVIYDPVKDETFWAEKGKGAFINNKRLRVSGRTNMQEAAIAMGTPKTGEEDAVYNVFLEQLDAVLQRAAATRRMGAASLDLAYVAAGRFDGYWEIGIQPWDVAAGAIIVKEAGGLVCDIDGRNDYVHGGTILATNSQLQRDLRGLVTTTVKRAS